VTTLRELEATFLKCEDGGKAFRRVATIGEADGVEFLCPVCFAANRGPVGTHGVICWAPSVQQSVRPGPGRWSLQGSSLDDLTLVAPSSSIALKSGCAAHFFVQSGKIVGA
jgi:hypothetical protein